MFDFEKLMVYRKSKDFNQEILCVLEKKRIHRVTADQLRRAAFSIMLNIAEGSGRYTNADKRNTPANDAQVTIGSGRYTNADKRNFYVIARGSVFECVAILDYLKDKEVINQKEFHSQYQSLEEISRMLYSLIQSLKK